MDVMTRRMPGRGPMTALVLALALSACGTTVRHIPSDSLPLGSGDGGLGGAPGSTAGPGTPSGEALPGGSGPGASVNGPGGPFPGGAPNPIPTTGGVAQPPSGSRITTPIEIGMLVSPSSASAQSALGSSEEAASGFGSDATFRALVKYYNARGGLSGRKIVPVVYTANATNASYTSDAGQACATFTQDNHVAAVISTTGDFWSDDYTHCLTKAKVPHLLMSFGSTDDEGFASNPSMFVTSTVPVDARITAMLTMMIKTKKLSRGDKLGVIVEACPFNTRAYTRTLEPLAKREGLTISRRDIDCITGYSDAGKAIGQVQASVLPYNTENIQKILPLSGWETSVVDFFEKQAQSQQYAPTYFVSSAAQMASQQSNFTASALSRIFGTGWMPTTDVASYPASPATRECRKILSSYGITAQNRADQYLVDGSCDPFRYLDAALTRTGGASDAATLTAALESLGGKIPSSVTLDADNGWGPRHHFAAQQVDAFSYQPTCSCFQYLHVPQRLS